MTLKGFKSFAESTTLDFEPGVTVVVGPNGSGKSNVVDAIAWVLGAQAPGSVRSQKMEDVIFAGTVKRQALGRAEVSLTIDNTAKIIPLDFNEITISRTLFRDGDSEYAMNNVPCRLLDIQEMLSDSGVGRHQHVIVSQGQIDKAKKNVIERKKLHVHYWIHGLPLRMRFPKSKLYESVFTPIIIGLAVGFIAAIMGIGGAFILVPAMIYIIKMPTRLVPGTSLFVTIFVSVIVTFLHSINYGSIDLMLVLLLVVGSIFGVQVGQKLGEQIDSSGLKALLAILLLIVGIAIAYDTFFAEEIQKEAIKIANKDLNF